MTAARFRTTRKVYESHSRSITRDLIEALLGFAFPAACLACEQPLQALRQPLGLCSLCRQKLAPPADNCCQVCGTTLWTHPLPVDGRCPGCRARPPHFDRLLAAWSYQPPFDAVVRGLKFGRLEYLGRQLALSLLSALGSQLDGHDLVVAVPLHWRRWLQRGYNQAEAIARPLAKRLRVPLCRGLYRPAATRPQSGLTRRQRAHNVRSAFAARRSGVLVGKRILLLDDVATTGATLEQASRCLKSAGAHSVTAVVAGRTPTA